jgi:hypothetical protein
MNSSHSGFLIDPSARSVAPWVYDGDWQTIAPAIRIGSSPFTIVEIGDGDVIYVDDEGLLKPLDWFFAVKGGHQPFAGCGLVLGTDAQGEAVTARIALGDLKRRVLHLRIVGKNPIHFLAWDAVDPTPGPARMTLDEIEAWMADLDGIAGGRSHELDRRARRRLADLVDRGVFREPDRGTARERDAQCRHRKGSPPGASRTRHPIAPDKTRAARGAPLRA